MKKFFVKPISFVLVLFILFGVFIFPTSAEEIATSRTVINGQEDGIFNGRTYSFINVGTNKAIDVNAGNTSQGSGIDLYSYFDDTPCLQSSMIFRHWAKFRQHLYFLHSLKAVIFLPKTAFYPDFNGKITSLF